jgi:hypothetical protein
MCRFSSRSVGRPGADFLVLIIGSKVGPAQMGPIVCARGWGLFIGVLCTNGNRPNWVSGKDL